MHQRVQQHFFDLLDDRGVKPRRVLEVGGRTNKNSLLLAPAIQDAEQRIALNLAEQQDRDGMVAVVGNANDMAMYTDGAFDLVLCNATLEHDRCFWRSLAEMKRVLRPGGLLAIGVPGYTEDPERDHGKSTHTYKVHYKFDYYRFSEQAVREVFFEGMRDVVVESILAPPRIIGHGYKPTGPLTPEGVAERATMVATRARRRASRYRGRLRKRRATGRP